eukprot:jgi/Psemu1/57418/gm1.57418_g
MAFFVGDCSLGPRGNPHLTTSKRTNKKALGYLDDCYYRRRKHLWQVSSCKQVDTTETLVTAKTSTTMTSLRVLMVHDKNVWRQQGPPPLRSSKKPTRRLSASSPSTLVPNATVLVQAAVILDEPGPARPGQARHSNPIQSNPSLLPCAPRVHKEEGPTHHQQGVDQPPGLERPAALFRADPSLTAIATALTDHDQQLKLIRSKAG